MAGIDDGLADTLIKAVKKYVLDAFGTLTTRLDSIELRLHQIPAGARGEPGEKGAAGERGEPGLVGEKGDRGDIGEKGERGIDGSIGPVGDRGEKGERGDVGEKGERGDRGDTGPVGEKGERGEPGEKGDTGVQGDTGEKGEPGLPGKDAVFDEEQLVGRLASTLERKLLEQIAALPAPADGRPGRDGESVHPDTIALMVEQAMQRAIGQIPAAKNGEPGRDAAAIDTLPAVAPDKSYPRGTYAEYRGGTIRSIRQTLPLGDGASLEASGWVVNTNGIDSEEEQLQDDGRTLLRRTVYTNGRVFERSFQFAVVIDRGVWRDGQFKAGDHVSCEGSGWIAQCDTTDRPGKSDAWRLSTKRGRDGKNFDDVGAVKGTPVVRVG